MPHKRIKINRAPVLTLWGAVVAERLGYDCRLALTLGKAVAGLNAQAKGQRLGIFEKPKEKPLKVRRKAEKPTEQKAITLMRRIIPIDESPDGQRAIVKDEPIDPQSVRKYLEQKFGEDLNEAQSTMEALAKSFKPQQLATEAYGLYEKFRPAIPEGEKGWGAKGVLDLDFVRSLRMK